MQAKTHEHFGPLQPVEQAAVYIDKSQSYLNRLRSEGGGPAFFKIGSRVSYSTNDLDAWLAERRRTSTSDPGPILPHVALPATRPIASIQTGRESSTGAEPPE